MKAKLILWFADPQSLLDFLGKFIASESGLHLEVYSALSYKMVTIPDISAYALNQGQLRFNAGTKGFTLNTSTILRQEIKFYEIEE